MASLIVLDLFDNPLVVNAFLFVDRVDEKLGTLTGQYITSSGFEVTVIKDGIAANIKYVFDSNTASLDDAFINIRRLPDYNNQGDAVSLPTPTFADINLKPVFDNIAENKEYIQEWFDWLKEYNDVIDTNVITLKSDAVSYYEGLLK